MGNNLVPGEHSPEFDDIRRVRGPPPAPTPPAYKIPENLVLPKEIPIRPLRPVNSRSTSLPATIQEDDLGVETHYGSFANHHAAGEAARNGRDLGNEVTFGRVYRTYENEHFRKASGDVKIADASGILRNANGALRSGGNKSAAQKRKKYRAPPPPRVKSPAPARPSHAPYRPPMERSISEPVTRSFEPRSILKNAESAKVAKMTAPPPPPVLPPMSMTTKNTSKSNLSERNAANANDNTGNKSRISERKLSADLQNEIIAVANSMSNRPVSVTPLPRVNTDPHDLFKEELQQVCRSRDSRKSSAQIDDQLRLSRSNSMLQRLENVKKQLAEIKANKSIQKIKDSDNENVETRVVATKQEPKTKTETKTISEFNSKSYAGLEKPKYLQENKENSPKQTRSDSVDNDSGEKLGEVVNLINIKASAGKRVPVQRQRNVVETDAEWTPADVLKDDEDDVDDDVDMFDFNRSGDEKKHYTSRAGSMVEEVMYTPGVKIKTGEASFGSLRHCRSRSNDSLANESNLSGKSGGRRRSGASKAVSSLRAIKNSVVNAFSSFSKGTIGSKDRRSVRGFFSGGDMDGDDGYGRGHASSHGSYYDGYSDNGLYYRRGPVPPGMVVEPAYQHIPIRLSNEAPVIYGQPARSYMYPEYAYGYPPPHIQYAHRPYVPPEPPYVIPYEETRSGRVRRRLRKRLPSSEDYYAPPPPIGILPKGKNRRQSRDYMDNWNSLKDDIQYDMGFKTSRISRNGGSNYSSGSEEREEYYSAHDEWIDDSEPDYMRATDPKYLEHRNSSSMDAPVFRKAKNQTRLQSDGNGHRSASPGRSLYKSRDEYTDVTSADDNNNRKSPHVPKLTRSSPETLNIKPDSYSPKNAMLNEDTRNRSTVYAYSDSLERDMNRKLVNDRQITDKPVLQVLPTNLQTSQTSTMSLTSNNGHPVTNGNLSDLQYDTETRLNGQYGGRPDGAAINPLAGESEYLPNGHVLPAADYSNRNGQPQQQIKLYSTSYRPMNFTPPTPRSKANQQTDDQQGPPSRQWNNDLVAL